MDRIYLNLNIVILLMSTPVIMLFSSTHTWILIVIPVVLLWPGSARTRMVASPLNIPVLGLSFAMLLSIYATYSLDVSLEKVAGLLLGITSYFVFLGYSVSLRRWLQGFGLLLFAGFAIALVSLLGVRWPSKLPIIASAVQILPKQLLVIPGAELGLHPNEVAGALLWTAPANILLLITRSTDLERLLDIGRRSVSILKLLVKMSAFFVTVVIVFSQSRTAILSLVAVLTGAITLLYLDKKILVGWMQQIKIIGSTLVIACAVIFILSRSNPDALNDLPFADLTGTAMSLDNMRLRVDIWVRAIIWVEEFTPLGIGMNAFRYIAAALFPVYGLPPNLDIGHAHNIFLQVALDLGLLGLISYLCLNIISSGMAIRMWKCRKQLPMSERLGSFLLLGLVGGLWAHLAFGLVDAISLGAKPGLLWWLLLSLIASLYTQTFGNVCGN